jgi:transposase
MPMSTSFYYHTFGTVSYKYLKIEYLGNQVHVHMEKKKSPRRCKYCKHPNIDVHETIINYVKTIPIGLRETFLVLHLKRFRCQKCWRTFREKRDIADPRKSYSRKFARFVNQLAHFLTIVDICKLFKVKGGLVREIIKKHLKEKKSRIRWTNLKYIAIDEFAIQKGHKYMTVVLDLETGRILYSAKGKDSKCLKGFFTSLKRRRVKIKAIAMDLSKSFVKAVRDYSKTIPIVFDHFHIISLMNKALDNIRRSEQKRLNDIGDKTGAKWIKGKRYLMLKGEETLDSKSQSKLDLLFENNILLQKTYLLKEWLRSLWKFSSKKECNHFLDIWLKEAYLLENIHLNRLCKTLEKHREMILNWYDHKITTAKLEGTNNKIKVLKRKGYGYRNLEFFGLLLLFLHETSYKLTGV